MKKEKGPFKIERIVTYVPLESLEGRIVIGIFLVLKFVTLDFFKKKKKCVSFISSKKFEKKERKKREIANPPT